jgi:hypothetical protein
MLDVCNEYSWKWCFRFNAKQSYILQFSLSPHEKNLIYNICSLSGEARNFFPEFNIRLYDKNSESDYFFSSTKIRIFFSATLGIRIFFLLFFWLTSLQGKIFLTATWLKLMKFVLLLLPGHFLIQPLFQRFCPRGNGHGRDVRNSLFQRKKKPSIIGRTRILSSI